jgi:hypothetical protein
VWKERKKVEEINKEVMKIKIKRRRNNLHRQISSLSLSLFLSYRAKTFCLLTTLSLSALLDRRKPSSAMLFVVSNTATKN